MYKLNGHSLSRGEKIIPETQPMTLQERDSSSTITLDPETAPEIGFNDWILDDDWPEGNYIWRVKSIGDTPLEENITVELEHVIKTLDDLQIVGEITTEMISGGSTCTARQAVNYLLGLQSDWALGDFDYNVSNPYEFTGGSILDGIETVTGTLEDSQWEYDLSVYPFRLHIRRRSTDAACEMRGGRNLSTLRKSISRSGMFTRIYPIGKNNLHIDGDYLSKNENLYGRVDRVETDQNKTTKENLRAWAQGLLNRHCEPELNISISGLEMSAETGESLDRLKLNRVCRVPLPKRNAIILERIVRLQWRDRRKEPENVSVSLANNSADIATIVKNSRKASGRAAQGQAKQNYLFQANGENLLYEVFNDCGHVHGILRMTSESLRIAFDNTIESTRSEFRMTSESLRIQFENDIASTRSEFQMTSESLRIQFENDISSTRSEFQMTAESMRIAFANDLSSTRSEFRMTAESMRIAFANDLSSVRSEFSATAESMRIAFSNDVSSVRAEVQVQAGRIGLVVEGTGANAKIRPAQIVAAVNGSGSTVLIDASKIKIGGSGSTVTLGSKMTVNGDGDILIANNAITSTGFHGDTTGNHYYAEQQQGHEVKIGILKKAAVEGNTLKIWKFGDAESSPSVTFSKATSLSGAWSGNTYTVTASPQGNTQSDTVYQQIEGAVNPNATIYAKMYHSNPSVPANQIGNALEMTLGENVSGKYVEIYTGSGNSKIQKGKIGTTGTYNAGWTYGQTRIVRTTRAATDQELTIKTLDYSERFTIIDTYTKPDGSTSEIKYIVAAKADRWQTGFDAGVPTGATLGSRVTGTTYNVSIARGNYAAVGKTIDVSSAYADAREGYYTQAQYNANYNAGWTYGQTRIVRTTRAATDQELTIKTLDYSERFTIIDTYTKPDGSTSEIKYIVAAKADRWQTGFDAGVPTGATLGSRVTGTTYNVSIARGNYTAVGKTIDVSGAYADARDGYTANSLIENTKDYGTVTSNGSIEITPSSGKEAMKKATITVNCSHPHSITLNNATQRTTKASLASALGCSESDLTQCFSSYTLKVSGYYGFRINCNSEKNKYYYFYIGS